jgi:hypothetical protein
MNYGSERCSGPPRLGRYLIWLMANSVYEAAVLPTIIARSTAKGRQRQPAKLTTRRCFRSISNVSPFGIHFPWQTRMKRWSVPNWISLNEEQNQLTFADQVNRIDRTIWMKC